jgi:hypothetical protein
MVSKSEAIRQLLRVQPNIITSEAIAALKRMNVKVTSGLFYSVKSSMKQPVPSQINNRPKMDTLTVINSVKALAQDVGGLKILSELVEAMQ